MSVRISATDWHPAGITDADSLAIAQAFKDAGADLIDVSTGQTSREGQPVYGRMFQTPYADRIRNEAGIATMAVGNIYEPDHVNSIIAAGRADLCAVGRPHLADPNWTLHAAAQAGLYRYGMAGAISPRQSAIGAEPYAIFRNTAAMKPFLLKLFAPRPTFHLDMTDAEREVLERHGGYWRDLLEKKIAVAFGPVLEPKESWGVALLYAEDDDAAQVIADNDPAAKAGMHIEIYPMAALVH